VETFDISFDLTSSDYDCGLGFEVFYNNKQILNIDHCRSSTILAFTLDAEEGDQELKFIMKNKTMDHTTVDENGQIVKDAYLNISNFTINSVELGHTFLEQCKYHHDFNGSQEPVVDKFWEIMGCNGTLIFSFQSPIYLWLVMNM
jgi:hypothetical protein|tara:strand:+ start:120 stop:554 length:435 start_codon:yes stop_codon:yes gene_type:complete